MRRPLFPIVCVLFLALSSMPLLAHRLKIFAYAEGSTIRGSVYFPGGGPARHLQVRIEDPDGKLHGSVTTDEAGTFVYRMKEDHACILVVQTADGHRAAYTVPATAPTDNSSAASDGAAAMPSVEMDAAVSNLALSRDIEALRRELEAQDDRRRLHDIIGGVGYIFGILGVVLYVKTRA